MLQIKTTWRRAFSRTGRILRRILRRPVAWWKRGDKYYGLPWRLGSLSLAALVLFATALPLLEQIDFWHSYRLDSVTKQLVGENDDTLSDKLTFDQASHSFQFNHEAIKEPSSNPLANMQTQVGGSEESLYALSLREKGDQGVTYHDVNSGLTFDLVPEFVSSTGKKVDGHLVYPIGGGNQMVYTLKNNGLKEDIIVKNVRQETLNYSYRVELPKTLEMRKIPDGNGAIGVYSADPSLFGSLEYSNDNERSVVEKARETAEKNFLVFGLPAPVALDPSGKTVGSSRFELEGSSLKVVTEGLANVEGPISIDPSVVVTSTSDFQSSGNNEGNISFTTPNQVSRSGAVGGAFRNGWQTTTPLPAANNGGASVSHNGFIYTLGGSGLGTTVYYTAINSNGTLGSWQPTANITTPRTYAGAAVYNNYLYLWGGYNTTTNTATATVEYSRINPDGSLGPWQTTSSMMTAVCRAGMTSHSGYLYAFGGSTTPNSGCTAASNGATSTVQYADIKADGSVGTWKTTTNIAYGTGGAVINAMAGAFNGYMYLAGGSNNGGGTAYNNVHYAAINSDGSLSSWSETSSLTTAIYGSAFSVVNGYIYAVSNQSSSASTWYSQIYANGQLSPWRVHTAPLSGRPNGSLVVTETNAYFIGGGSTNAVNYSWTGLAGYNTTTSVVSTPFSTTRERGAAVAYGGCLVVVGGYGGGGNNYVDYAQSAPINADGNITTSWGNRSFSNGRADLAAVAYDGYVYVIGGYSGQTNTYYNNVRYAAINNDCSLGAWANTTDFDTSSNARGGISAVAHNGYIYVTGGRNASGDFSSVRYAAINSNGTLGSWQNTTALPNSLNRHRTVTSGNYIYVLGGTKLALPNVNNGATTGSRPTGAGVNTSYYTTMNSDGTLGSWSATSNLPQNMYEFGATSSDGYLYVSGGYTSSGSGMITTYSAAAVNSDGTLGNWTTTTDTGETTGSNILVAADGYLYDVVGRIDSDITNSGRRSIVRYSSTNNGGRGIAGDWTATSSLVNGRDRAGSTAYNGRVYVVGGSSTGGSTARNDIEYSTVNSSGNLGNFTADPHTLSSGRMQPGVTAYNEHLYVLGGQSPGSYHGDVSYAPISANGSLGGNFATISSFVTGSGSDTGRAGTCVAVYGGYMYAAGGFDGTTYHNTVRFAAINADGTLGSWQDSGQTFTDGRAGAGCFAANNRLYILGGNSGSAVFNDVQTAVINNNGTLGSWSSTTRFMNGRTNFVSGYSNGFVYIYGGCTTTACTAGYGDIQYTTINSNGSFNKWQRRPTTNTGYTPYLSAGMVYGGYLYALGGGGHGANTATTTYAPLSIAARIGVYSKLIDLGSSAQVTSITWGGILSNNRSPGLSPVSFRSADSNGVFREGLPSTSITPSPNRCNTASSSFTRYILITVLLDDSLDSVFTDKAHSFLSDITVKYELAHPTPDIRLRAGQTLQEGSLSALDTCYP